MNPPEVRARPLPAELVAAASLLNVGKQPVKQKVIGEQSSGEQSIGEQNSDHDLDLPQLDYHGITMLALDAGTLSAPLTAELQARKAMMVATEALKTQALRELANACEKVGLDPLVFKGSALAYLIYPKPWLRPRTDTDLLIAPNERTQFERLFVQLGYQKLFAIEGDLVSYQATYCKALTNKVALNIDLHWRISNRQILARTFSKEELAGRAKRLPELGFSTLSNSDHLLVACLHRLGHHQREERLAWLYDIHLLSNTLSPSQWNELADLASQKSLSALTYDALATCQDLFTTVFPEGLLASLKHSALKPEPSAVFLRRELPEWRIVWYELAALPSNKLRWQWLKETLFPSADYLRQQMGRESLLVAHIERTLRGLRRIFRREQ